MGDENLADTFADMAPFAAANSVTSSQQSTSETGTASASTTSAAAPVAPLEVARDKHWSGVNEGEALRLEFELDKKTYYAN